MDVQSRGAVGCGGVVIVGVDLLGVGSQRLVITWPSSWEYDASLSANQVI